MFKIDLPALENRLALRMLELEDYLDGVRTRIREWIDNEREGHAMLVAMAPSADEKRWMAWMAREEIRHEYPNVTDLGLDFIVWVNGIRWNIEMAEYVITGRYCKAWRDEFARQEMEEYDDRLLSYAY